MIKKSTVLILGAGASVPYGFPSGQKLMQKILEDLHPDKRSKLFNTLVKFDIKNDEIDDFYRSLSRSGKLSVDAFLEHRIEFLKVGRLSITLKLSEYENEENLFRQGMIGKSWYEYLWNKLSDAPFEQFNENQLSILTFNYDRSVEYYFITVMMKLYGKSEEACAKKLNKIPIIHVHGKLGALPWQECQEGLERSYCRGMNLDQVEKVSEQIKVIPEKEGTSPEFREAFKIMGTASEICFLGFGYHANNLRRLRKEVFSRKRPKGTAFGLGITEREQIMGDWGIKLYEDYNEVLEFLKNHVTLR